MYVYVTKFSDNPTLIKIGKSVNPASRTEQLTRWHGDVVHTNVYFVGHEYSQIESALHKKYAKSRVKIKGDGGSEFFFDDIYDEVHSYLGSCVSTSWFDRHAIESELKKELIRVQKLAGELMGCDTKWFRGISGEICPGFWEHMSLTICIGVGFEPKEVFAKYSEKSKKFTTPKRVELAYNLHSGSTVTSGKIERLKKLLADNPMP